MHYFIALHYDALPSHCASCSRAAFSYCAASDKGDVYKNTTQCITRPHGDKTPHHPLTLQQSRATHFSSDGRLLFLTMHTLTQACVCAYRQKISGLGHANDVMSCCRGLEDKEAGLILGCVADLLGGVCSTSSPLLMLCHPPLVVALLLLIM